MAPGKKIKLSNPQFLHLFTGDDKNLPPKFAIRTGDKMLLCIYNQWSGEILVTPYPDQEETGQRELKFCPQSCFTTL
jgi:hypothetical protein